MSEPHVIESMIVAVAIDSKTGDEGVVAFMDGITWIPLIASDRVREQQIRTMAERIAKERGLLVHLLRFETRTVVEVIDHRI